MARMIALVAMLVLSPLVPVGAVPQEHCCPVQGVIEMDPGLAGFAYLLALGAHALRRASLAPGERVAVVRLGLRVLTRKGDRVRLVQALICLLGFVL